MALPWLTALKVIPWGDVIEHAPAVLKGARDLLERQRLRRQEPVPHELQQQLATAREDLARLLVWGAAALAAACAALAFNAA